MSTNVVQDVFSFSSVACYNECPRKYYFRYATDEPDTGSTEALTFGKQFHAGMEAACYASYFGQDIGAAVLECDLPAPVNNMLRAYIPHLQLGDRLRVYTFNDTPALEIPFEVDIDGVKMRGMIDAVLLNRRDEILLVDWKTRGYFAEGMPAQLDAQLHLYAYAARQIGLRYDRVAQIQFAKQTPSIPLLTKEGVVNKRLGKTTQEVFDRTLKMYGLNPDDHRGEFEDKILPIETFIQTAEINPHPDLYAQQFARTVRRMQTDDCFDPVSSSNVCKWCGYKESCITKTAHLAGKAGVKSLPLYQPRRNRI